MFERYALAQLKTLLARELPADDGGRLDIAAHAAAALTCLTRGADRSSSAEDLADFTSTLLTHQHRSSAQLLQDIWVLYELRFLRDGYFVEFGACDGALLSNTLLLEREYGWNGLVAEPNPTYHADLRANRRCSISTACVHARDGDRVVFRCTRDGAFSTMADFVEHDMHASTQRGQGFTDVTLETTSLDALLRQFNAPRRIDFMSIDTEGSELTILNAFDFSAWDIRLLAVEHNFTPARSSLDELLRGHGYRRKFEAFSLWDSWYVKADQEPRVSREAASPARARAGARSLRWIADLFHLKRSGSRPRVLL